MSGRTLQEELDQSTSEARRIDDFVNRNAESVKNELEARLRRLDEFDDNGKRRTTAAAQRRLSLKDKEMARRRFGPCTRFGEGDGTFWDRWLVAPPPRNSPTLGKGTVLPRRGFKLVHPARYHMPTELVVQEKHRRTQQQEKSLTDLLAEEVQKRVKNKRASFAKASQAAAATIDNVRARSRRNLLEAAAAETAASASAGAGAGAEGRDGPGRALSASAVGDYEYPHHLPPGTLRTDRAKAAADRFQRQVEASIKGLRAECHLPDELDVHS